MGDPSAVAAVWRSRSLAGAYLDDIPRTPRPFPHSALLAFTALPLRDLGAGSCTPSFGTAVPCVSATTPALTLASAPVALATGR